MVVTSTRAGKNKGQKFQKEIVKDIRKTFNLDVDELSCFEGDVQARQMGGSGTDIILSPHAKTLFAYAVEAKRQENWNVHKWWTQATSNESGLLKPLLVMRRNHGEALCMLRWSDFLNSSNSFVDGRVIPAKTVKEVILNNVGKISATSILRDLNIDCEVE